MARQRKETKLKVVETAGVPESPEARLRSQLASLGAALAKAEAHYWNAIHSIASDGVGIMVEVGDSHGKTHKKLRTNPAVRVAREAERTVDELKAKIAALKNDLAQLEGEADGWTEFNAGQNG